MTTQTYRARLNIARQKIHLATSALNAGHLDDGLAWLREAIAIIETLDTKLPSPRSGEGPGEGSY